MKSSGASSSSTSSSHMMKSSGGGAKGFAKIMDGKACKEPRIEQTDRITEGASEEDCYKHCQETAGCKYFTWFKHYCRTFKECPEERGAGRGEDEEGQEQVGCCQVQEE